MSSRGESNYVEFGDNFRKPMSSCGRLTAEKNRNINWKMERNVVLRNGINSVRINEYYVTRLKS